MRVELCEVSGIGNKGFRFLEDFTVVNCFLLRVG